jgi:uncharacterized membrane protein YkvA (DUF1232 family)
VKFESLKIPQKIIGQVKLLWFLYRDPRTPKSFKILVWVIFLYLLMPFDIIPDFIPVLGQLDDLLVVVIGVKFLMKLCPPELVEEGRRQIQT